MHPTSGITPAQIDVELYELLRSSVASFWDRAASEICSGQRVLDVGPPEFDSIASRLASDVTYETLDLDPDAGATITADLCDPPESLPWGRYDHVIATEVIEHTLEPFAAVESLRRLLKPAGVLWASTPFNYRIHGPLPDCWRITEYGWQSLLRGFADHDIDFVESPGRPLMPISYQVRATS